jgi:hypothetical protein
MHQKNVIRKNVTEICTFFTFTHVRQTCFAYNFFGAFLITFSTDSKSAWNSAVFDTFFDFFKKKFVLFSNFEAKRAKKNGSKNQKTYLVNVS